MAGPRTIRIHRLQVRKLKLAMRIGGEYGLWRIGRRQWERLADGMGLEPEPLVQRVGEVAAAIPDLLAAECRKARDEGLDHPLLARLADAVAEQAGRAIASLARSARATEP